jgi:molybdate transport system substrate-binding protein
VSTDDLRPVRLRRPFGRRALAAVTVIAAVVVLGACSSGGSSGPNASGTTTTTVAPDTTSTSTLAAPAAAASSTTTTSTTVAKTTTTTTAPKTTTTTLAPLPPVTGTIQVYAAQSLAGAFTEIGAAFQRKFPGTTVRFNFNGSATLVTQIFQGAPADVFASADQPNMDRVVSSGLMKGAPQIFTKNLLQIVVAPGNPKNITGLADLDNPGVTVDLCAPAVPCGNYARQALAKAGISVTPVSSEQNVTAVVTRVANGEADAGIVYQTDVLAAGSKVSGVVIPPAQNLLAEYPLAALKSSTNAWTAGVFDQFVESSAGQAILAKYSFLPL